MLSSELHYKVESIDDSTVLINNYKYLKVQAVIPDNIPMTLLISEKCKKNIEPGKHYYSKRAYLTSVDMEDDSNNNKFVFRIDYMSDSSKEEFDSKDESVVVFNARINKRKHNVIKNLGPMCIPTFSVKATLKNEMGNPFHVLVVGFHSKAKMLDDLVNICYVDIIGCVSGPRKPGLPCAIVVKDIILRKGVE